ncbi:putative quinol monooxygenase [Chryseobacterium sp. FH1]|uniref:putative quinol monooxygenase n=1 Tax=Chryseobacterium sp. FH1 TaxID=1233951 RepID=UPI0004E3067F|nr:putative quinol monooxygenase [Chryseobacterium sp. FH1]KFC22876.1 antibiotic biosynthesis monooxygenase [Chryseobacterium sp. FH1]
MENQSQPIFIFAKWQVKNGELQTVLDLLPSLIEKSTNEEGNIFYKIYQDNSDSNTLILNESYKDMASIEVHKNSNHYQEIAVKQIIPLLENREVILASELDLG